jgi:hypothetical protein
MGPFTIAGIVFGVIFLGALSGVILRARLPDDHMGEGSKDVVRLVMGLIATMSALVLGLLIASTKTSYDTQSGELTHLSADVIQLDRTLSQYGPVTPLPCSLPVSRNGRPNRRSSAGKRRGARRPAVKRCHRVLLCARLTQRGARRPHAR